MTARVDSLPSRNTTPAPFSLRAIWSAAFSWLSSHAVRALALALFGAALGVGADLVIVRLRQGFTAAGLSPRDVAVAMICWTLGSVLVTSIVAYWWTAGTKRVVEAVSRFPGSLASLFRAGGASASAFVFGGLGCAFLLSLIIPPAAGALVAIALIVALSSALGGGLCMLLGRLVPARRDRAAGPILMGSALLGVAVALGSSVFLTDTKPKLIAAGVCVVLALILGRRRGAATAALMTAFCLTSGAQPADVLTIDPRGAARGYSVAETRVLEELRVLLIPVGKHVRVHKWLTDIPISVIGRVSNADTNGGSAGVYIYRYEYRATEESPTGTHYRQILDEHWNKDFSTLERWCKWGSSGPCRAGYKPTNDKWTTYIEQTGWAPPGERGKYVVKKEMLQEKEIISDYLVFQRGSWIAELHGTPEIVQKLLPEIVSLLDRMDGMVTGDAGSGDDAGDLTVTPEEREARAAEDATNDQPWSEGLSGMLDTQDPESRNALMLALALALASGIGGAAGAMLGAALATISGGRPWWEILGADRLSFSDLPPLDAGDASADVPDLPPLQ